ncbi:LuxR family maltose regulon positive regulatory protein [Rhodococcus sp. LBL1]|nr:LuxR family maltose regulon positive regulatory protein [Rhodococcus sp. LBL1]MDH6685359.1 LuxR family maltose regulon positive regulatory protein [Rhodococcus sp. LBL2]
MAQQVSNRAAPEDEAARPSEGAPAEGSDPLPPRLSVAVQPRDDLYAVLDEVVVAPALGRVFVCAPVGTGKTVLLADWIARIGAGDGPAVAWLTLDALDDDPSLLEDRLGAALHFIASRDCDSSATRSILESVRLVSESARDAILVLDDVHVIECADSLRLLEHLLDAAPANLTVVLASRFAPGLPWVRYAADGSLTLIGWEDLALDRAAAVAIFAEHRCAVSTSELDAVLDLTGGWAVPVRIAATRLAPLGDLTSGIADLVRYPQSISEHVMGEMVSGLPDGLRRFVEATSIVDRFGPDLAACLDDANMDLALADRERFCVPIQRVRSGDELQYAWHPLVRAHMRSHLRATDPERLARLHAAAGDWFAGARQPIVAIEHLLEAGDALAIVDFVYKHGIAVVCDGHGDELLELLGPRHGDKQGVRLLRALDALEQNYPDAARTYFGTAVAADAVALRPELAKAFAAALAIEIAVISGQRMPTSPDIARDLQSGTGSVDLDCYVTTQRAAVCMLTGDLIGSERLLRQALAFADLGAHPRLVLRCLARLSIVSGIRGDLVTMTTRAEHALRYAVDQGQLHRIDAFQCAAAVCMDKHIRCEQLPDDSPIYALVSGPGQHQRPDGTTAPISGGHAEVAFAILEARRNPIPTVDDADTVARAMTGMLTRGAQAGVSNTFLTPTIAVLLDAGRLAFATEVVETAHLAFGENLDVRVARAMIFIVQGDSASAHELLDSVLEAPEFLHPALGVRAWVLRAVVAHRENRSADAAAAVRRALELAEPNGIVSPFVDCAGDAAELLSLIPPGADHTRVFLDHVQAKIVEAHEGRNPGLTRTEKVILAELRTGKPLRIIAQQLHVSLNTVRTHTRNVYRKLDASSRAEALEVAARRRLL